MVIDTSAFVAILFDEEERPSMVSAIVADDVRNVSSATLLETNMVVRKRAGSTAVRNLDLLLAKFGIEVCAFDAAQLAIAKDAFAMFGKGRHCARLNFGDLFAYALAKSQGEPLLFKGDDFAQTDICPAYREAD
jgi:ribonuclease VapC